MYIYITRVTTSPNIDVHRNVSTIAPRTKNRVNCLVKNKHTFIEENQHLSALYEMKEFVQYEVIDKNSIQPPLTFSYEGTAVNGMLSVRSIT